MKFYIRFGVHKDREVIQELREPIDGIFVPAHILSYSPNPTIAAVDYINKPHFIDPMTYIYGSMNIYDYVVIDKKTKKNNFKPSIAKLTADYGLTQYFANNNYAKLTPIDFKPDFVESLCKNSVYLQLNKIENEKQGAYKKYKDLLAKLGEDGFIEKRDSLHKPAAIIPPYFYFESLSDPWLGVNLQLINSTVALTEEPVVPIIFTNSNSLESALLDQYTGFSELFIWIDDLNEKDYSTPYAVQVQKLSKLTSFVKQAKERNVKITNLYGSYFSLLLSKLGMDGVCNGIFYGENKARTSRIGGGPPVRYYIRELHEFFPLPTAIRLLRDPRYVNLLDTECAKCMALIDGKPENIINFELDHSKAQRHFIYAREKEMENIAARDLQVLVSELETTFDTYSPLDSYAKKTIDYLKIWKEVLSLHSG